MSVIKDLQAFSRNTQQLEDTTPVAAFERLSAVCASNKGEVAWSVRGSFNPSGQPQLILIVRGQIDLSCQRCLDIFKLDLDTEASIIVAESEEKADEIEDALEDDDPTEVIVGGDNLDVMVLVEDEVLLSIPLSPRHDACPDNSHLVRNESKASPFAVLQGLKSSKGPGN